MLGSKAAQAEAELSQTAAQRLNDRQQAAEAQEKIAQLQSQLAAAEATGIALERQTKDAARLSNELKFAKSRIDSLEAERGSCPPARDLRAC